MDYQVLARKWRPQTFAQVVGQQHVLQALANALTHQRLHHAYLLTGTRGVGKTTIARILAKSLNCEQGITATPCGACDACVEIDEGRYVDLLEIDAASRTKVEDTRELLDNVQYRPTRGRYKVYLIDEVHMLSRHSFNALLKTLEEPPEHVKFLLATTDPEKLPVTVLSRCLQFHLRALTRSEIATQLREIMGAEGLPFDDEALALLARAARGSMRDALSLTDQAIAQGNQAIALDSVRHMLGHIEGRQVLRLLSHIVAGDASEALQSLRAMQDKVPDIAVVLPELQNALHQVALMQVSADFADTEVFKDMAQLQQLAEQVAPELVQVLYRLVIEGRRELPHGIDAYTAVEMTVLRMLAFRPVDAASVTTLTQAAPESTTHEYEAAAKPTGVAVEESVPEPAVPEPAAPEPAAPVEQPTQHSATPPQDTPTQAAPMAQPSESKQDTPKQEVPSAHDDSMASTPVDHYADDDDDDYLSPDEMAALAQEQSSIMAQAASQHPSHGSESKPPAQAQPEQARTAQADESDAQQAPEPAAAAVTSDLERLLQTREALLAKKKAPLTAQTKLAAEVDSWSANIDNLQVKGRVRQILLNSRLRRSESGYTLHVDESQKVLCTPQSVTEVERLLRTLVDDASLTLEYGSVQMTPLVIQQAIDHYRAEQAMTTIKTNPMIQNLIQRFDATLDESSVKVTG